MLTKIKPILKGTWPVVSKFRTFFQQVQRDFFHQLFHLQPEVAVNITIQYYVVQLYTMDSL